ITTIRLNNSEIHPFLETNIQYALSKPNWDLLARYFLATGIHRPKREAIQNSQLRQVLRRFNRSKDVLPQIAVVNETIRYCERNGFTPALEGLIISNLYQRGWNIEKRLERTIVSIMGTVSPRFRAYIAAYLVLEKGEVSEEMLALAREVESVQIREKIVRSLSRFGTVDMWVTLAESMYDDITEEAMDQISKTRFSKDKKIQTTIQLSYSKKKALRDIACQWLQDQQLKADVLPKIISNPHDDIRSMIIIYALEEFEKFSNKHLILKDLILKIIWQPISDISLRKNALKLLKLLYRFESIELDSITPLVFSEVQAKSDEIIKFLSSIQ
ncbi:MAG: hypothetical protein ACXAD7_13125, partial [Candidatus Kariarchaeaceae archaeon]